MINQNSYFAHRQFYLNGLSSLNEKVYNRETGLTEAIQNLSPIMQYNGVSPIWVYDSVTTQNIYAFRNGDLISKKAKAYFEGKGVAQWEHNNTAVLCIPEWGLRSNNIEGEFEFFVFDEEGFLINNSLNSFVCVVSGVLYIFLSDCSKWSYGMHADDPEYSPTADKPYSERSSIVNVLVVRRNENLPYASIPKCESTDKYDSNSRAIVETNALPFGIYSVFSQSSSWSGYTAENYGLFITLGSTITVRPEEITDVSQFGQHDPSEIPLLQHDIASEISNIGSLTIEIPREKFKIQSVDELGNLSIQWAEGVTSVRDLGLTITVPFSTNECLSNEYTFTINKLPSGSQFFISNKQVQFCDELIIRNSTKAGEKYSIESKAYPAKLGLPYFDPAHGLSYIPLGKYFGNIEDYRQTIAGEGVSIDANDDTYTKIGGTPGSHAFPILKPKAEDVMVFVGNKHGMIKLTPYVDYTIEEYGTAVIGNMPVVMLRGRTSLEGDLERIHDGMNNTLVDAQSTFPNPIPTAIDTHEENINDTVVIRVFYGYPSGNISSYWGPNESIDYDRIKREHYGVFATYGYSIENTVERVNSLTEQFKKDNTLLATATMLNPEALVWSVLPRESFIQFNAGRYVPTAENYLSRIIFDRTFALNTSKFRDVELHARIDERYGIIEKLYGQEESNTYSYLDEIFAVLGVNLEDKKSELVAERSGVEKQGDTNNDPAFFFILNNGEGIEETIQSTLWKTWFSDAIDDISNGVIEDEP